MKRYSGLLVAAGMLLFAVIFFGVLIVIALDQIGDADDDAPDASGDCTFRTVTEPVLVYERYDSGGPDVTNALPAGQTYPVLRLSDQRVRILIEVDADKTGWVDRTSGELNGACESVPVEGAD
ncbi:MAG: hypothetical protein LC121_04170 [Anaerolineae bacterium]|nr:hypothetical protein [Anaerolineae bacterium]